MIVNVVGRPDLAHLVATWRVEEFYRPEVMTAARMTELILKPGGGQETFVLFDGGEPAATAGLVPADLESRPDLTPWLAGVFVRPEFRGRGHATSLVRRVEACARDRGVTTLWLYTLKAEGLYARLGWTRAGVEQDQGHQVVLMSKELQPSR